jgi:hypothetical protein
MGDLAAILSRRRAATDEAQDCYSANGDAILDRARVVENRPKDPVSHTRKCERSQSRRKVVLWA